MLCGVGVRKDFSILWLPLQIQLQALWTIDSWTESYHQPISERCYVVWILDLLCTMLYLYHSHFFSLLYYSIESSLFTHAFTIVYFNSWINRLINSLHFLMGSDRHCMGANWDSNIKHFYFQHLFIVSICGFVYVMRYWERGGQRSLRIGLLLSWLEPWLDAAVSSTFNKRQPKLKVSRKWMTEQMVRFDCYRCLPWHTLVWYTQYIMRSLWEQSVQVHIHTILNEEEAPSEW